MDFYMVMQMRAFFTLLPDNHARRLTGLLLFLAIIGTWGQAHAQSISPAIEITKIPGTSKSGNADITNPIVGRVKGASFTDYKVVLYAHAGDTWWVQPLADNPLTDISEDGRWQSETHPGKEYAAILVKNGYQPKAKISTLPHVGGDIAALDRKGGENPAAPAQADKPASDTTKPTVNITEVPPATKGGEDTYNMTGTAGGVSFDDCKIVVYAHAGGQWWVQPLADEPLTDIAADGKWQLDTHGGAQYAALLVKKGYHAKATVSILPRQDDKKILAEVQKDGKK